ncbi:lysylphosphatidylglycerol synthase transmembrane domain-containing protein [Halobacterium sp. CBA1126]|uniref:lysylphosphatidylglycerol synthase transmembrane domain-containing protein n=1 Tax=Halobacterium TaxID=2239 RepID=UPI0012F71370|nr:flippase-like domain-containing protein [Halobacterium sp. CBA1126]
MQREDLLATVAGLAGAAVVFAVMFWVVDAREVWAAASRADPVTLVAVAGVILLWNVSWGLALWNVLSALDIRVPLHTALLVNAAGAFANHVTPFGQAGGEPVTAWLLTQTADTDYEVSLASITSLDAINVVPSLAFAAVGSLYYVATGTGGDLGLLPVGVITAAVVVPLVVALAWRYRTTIRGRAGGAVAGVVSRVVGAIPRVSLPDAETVAERIEGFADALGRVAVSRERLVAALSCSALGWAFQAFALWLTFVALGASVPLYVPFFVIPLGKVGSVLPTPGGLGGTEAINVTLLTLLTAVSAPTIAAVVTIHSVGGYLLTTTVGAAATSALGVRA